MDSHAFLWFVGDDPQLSDTARNLIVDPANEVYLSLTSVWELTIKVSSGKLTLAQPPEQFFPEQLQRNDFQLLPISLSHATRVASLPVHHKDPFDRLLVAQSLIEPMPLISADAILDLYGVQRFW
jgi:PIN domain nuclease of toxin-antitoxin system